ncbi:unnamed protein product, partial [Trichogramma brassicae]
CTLRNFAAIKTNENHELPNLNSKMCMQREDAFNEETIDRSRARPPIPAAVVVRDKEAGASRRARPVVAAGLIFLL